MHTTTTTPKAPLPFHGGEQCYACDCTKVVGFRDRRPEGKDLEVACQRHTDPTVRVYEACVYCDGPTRKGSLDLGGLFAHARCYEAVSNDTFFGKDGGPRRR